MKKGLHGRFRDFGMRHLQVTLQHLEESSLWAWLQWSGFLLVTDYKFWLPPWEQRALDHQVYKISTSVKFSYLYRPGHLSTGWGVTFNPGFFSGRVGKTSCGGKSARIFLFKHWEENNCSNQSPLESCNMCLSCSWSDVLSGPWGFQIQSSLTTF